jgi:dTDP-4-dehydrorhamnose reductase
VKVLITGAGGQVSRALLRSVPPGIVVTALSHRELDISDAAAVEAAVRKHHPDAIINGAGYTGVDTAESEPGRARSVNTDGPRHLATAAQRRGARLIHISTDFVFDGRSSTPYEPEAATNPLGVYGETKRAGEEIVLRILPIGSVVLRTAWVYASEGRNFLLTMLRLMATEGTVRVVADQIGTPTRAESVARVLWKILERPSVRGIHHWTDAGVASWYDFAVAIAEEAAARGLLPSTVSVMPISTEEYPTPARRPSYSVLDKRSLAFLDLVPVHWRQGLRGVLEEMRHA